jgi:hypothetical protein
MGDIVNLRLARKQKARRDKDQLAQQKRILHGRTKAERERQDLETVRFHNHVEAHRRSQDSDV